MGLSQGLREMCYPFQIPAPLVIWHGLGEPLLLSSRDLQVSEQVGER